MGRPRLYSRDRICAGCGKEYEGYPGKPKGEKTYCSRKCSTDANRAEPGHQQRAGRKGGKVRGEQRKRERQTDWYLKQDGQHVHRVAAETCLGRALLPGEIVHHEDKNKHNNDPVNLIVFPSQADHARHHKLNHCGTPCDCPGVRLKEVMF